MTLYFAGTNYHEVVCANHALALQSFFYKKEIFDWWATSHNQPPFLDSGAFSAFTQGITINLVDYIAFIQENDARIAAYAVLDVIGDWQATAQNQAIMEAAGLHPIPTFHAHSPLSELERLVAEYDYIALGGLVPLAIQRQKLQTWLDACFAIIRDQCKVHGFGVNSLWAWERYPFYSVDSTSWLASARYGSSKHIKDKRLLFYRNARVYYRTRTADCLRAYQKDAAYVTQLWASRGVTWTNKVQA